MRILCTLLFFFALLFPLVAGSAAAPEAAPEPLVVATRHVPPFAIRGDSGWDGLTIPGSTSQAFLKRQMIRHHTAPSLTKALDAVAQGEADALVYDAPILRYLVSSGYADRLRILHLVLQRQAYGIALPAGSPLREDVNRALLQIVRSDEWQRLLERYLGRST